MPEDSREVRVREPDGQISSCRLRFPQYEPWYLVFEMPGREPINIESNDLFDCLCELRVILEEDGKQILCQGSRRNVYPSSMSREMSGGRVAYEHHLQQPTSVRLDILDPAAGDDLATVAQQKEYIRQWRESIMRRRT